MPPGRSVSIFETHVNPVLGAPVPTPTPPPKASYPPPNTSISMRTIKTCSGIGDILWLIMKLSTLGLKFDWRITAEAPQRGHQVFDLLPQTVNSVAYDGSFGTHIALAGNIQRTFNSWSEISNHTEFFLTCNHHFEAQPAGNLRDWLPDLGINYYLPYITHQWIPRAIELLNDATKKYVICYGASYMASRYWGGWQSEQWYEFITKLRALDSNFVPVIVGAAWDTDMAGRLMQMLDVTQIPYVRLIGENLGLVVEVMKRVKYAFYFPSGLGVIAGTLGVPATMWYPAHLATMPGTWCDPKLTQLDIFHEIRMCSPDEMIAYVNKRGGF